MKVNSHVFCHMKVHSRSTEILQRIPTRTNELKRANSTVLGLCDMVHLRKVRSHIHRVLINQSSVISRPTLGQSILMLDAKSVMMTWCGRNAELCFRYRDEGVNNERDRAYKVEINDWGDKSRNSRSNCGRSAMSGGEENTVVSRVMRRITHFLR